MAAGGTFADIWTPDTFAQAGLYISDTSTPGHVYELSAEHHVRTEVKLDHVGQLGDLRIADGGRAGGKRLGDFTRDQTTRRTLPLRTITATAW